MRKTTEEFAFKDLLPVQDDAHLLLVQQPGEEMVILIIKNGQMYFHRRLRGFSDIAQKSEDELAFGMIDSISLEIQRSTDYFERQLKQAPIKTIKVLTPNDNEAFIARKLSENTNVAVELFSLPEHYANYRHRRVVANIQTFLAENNTDSAAIQAHEDTEHGIVVEVMNQAKVAGINKVSVLVKE